MYIRSKTKFSQVIDGLSKTLLVGELAGDIGFARTWMAGVADPTDGFGWVYAGKNLHWPLKYATRQRKQDEPALRIRENDLSFNSFHPGGVHFAFGDGAGKFIPEDIDEVPYFALGSRSGEEIIEDY